LDGFAAVNVDENEDVTPNEGDTLVASGSDEKVGNVAAAANGFDVDGGTEDELKAFSETPNVGLGGVGTPKGDFVPVVEKEVPPNTDGVPNTFGEVFKFANAPPTGCGLELENEGGDEDESVEFELGSADPLRGFFEKGKSEVGAEVTKVDASAIDVDDAGSGCVSVG
jgi:hypothetical protein